MLPLRRGVQGGTAYSEMAKKKPQSNLAHIYQHTNIAVYLVGFVAVASLIYDSTQGIVQKYELNRKWFYLYGATCFFAYLYVRPLIRRGLGSASRGYINFYSVYIGWLCSAVFVHLPKFKALGFDIKTDVSLLLTIFLLSCLVLSILHAVHSLLVFFNILAPRLLVTNAGLVGSLSLIMLNSMNLAVACSTYYSFCGNAAKTGAASGKGIAGEIRSAVCNDWLKPIDMNQHPTFSSWVIYGEEAGVHGMASEPTNPSFRLDIDGIKFSHGAAATTVSPVFSLWLTFVLMYIVNSMADYNAAGVLMTARSGKIARRPSMKRRHSFDLSKRRSFLAAPGRKSLDLMQRSASEMMNHASLRTVSGMLRNFSANLPDTLLAGLPGSLLPPHTPRPISVPQTARAWRSGDDASMFKPGGGMEEDEHISDEQPDFLPMFPWYSGTSADMYRTIFGLVVSLKLFLGRFDMRTMQAATGAGPPGGGRQPPREGDGFTYEHLADRKHVWIDFCADTGDGGDPTYSVARAMAAPILHVKDACPASVKGTAPEKTDTSEVQTSHGEDDLGSTDSIGTDSSSGLDSPREGQQRDNGRGSPSGRPFPGSQARSTAKLLPRGDVLVLGGDLAYPNPSQETYELRFFAPFEAAMPPPPKSPLSRLLALQGVHPGRLVVNKPDIPMPSHRSRSLPCSSPESCCTAHTDLGKSAHTGDSDCRACSAAEALRSYDGPAAFAIPGNHDWIDGLETFQRYIQHRGWLGGWLLPQEKSYFALRLPHGWWLFGLDLALVDDIDMCQCRYFARIADERMKAEDQAILVTHQPMWLADWFKEKAGCQNLRQLVRCHLRGRARIHLAGDLHFYMRHSFKPAPLPVKAAKGKVANGHLDDLSGADPFAETAPSRLAAAKAQSEQRAGRHASISGSSVASSDADEAELGRDIYQDLASFVQNAQAANSQAVAGGGLAPSPTSNLHPFDPEHLIVNGLGGAFLHPTHVFAPARFASVPDPHADELFEQSLSPRGRSPRGSSPHGGSPPRGRSPSRGLSRRGSFVGELPTFKIEADNGAVAGGGGEFSCAAVYPSPKQSLQLGRQNLHLFRFKNTRFDIIGGAFYFLMVVSVLPRCNRVAQILDAHTLGEGLGSLALAALDALTAIFAESYLSLGAVIAMFILCWCMASSGGYGAVPYGPPPPPPGRTMSFWDKMSLKGRTGGLSTQLTAALAHASAHILTAVVSLVLLELGVETCIRYEELGKDGFHSLYRWYQEFEAQHFPDPAGLRESIAKYTLHLYPAILKAAMAVFDVPEAIAVTRTAMCSGGTSSLPRFQGAAYYLGMLAYYWVLVTPSVGFLFGCYLYLSVNWFHVHYDEAFSSLQIPHHKGFSRIHVTPEGDLHIYGLAIDKVACEWREDPHWRGPNGGGSRRQPAHRAEHPSRWLPLRRPQSAAMPAESAPAEGEVRMIDYLVVPKERPFS